MHSLTGRLAQPDANSALDQAAAALAQHSMNADAAGPLADEEEVIAPEPPVDLTSADADKRMATASSRGVLEAERTILAATSHHFKTYVICPGLLYGMDAMPMWQLRCQISASMEQILSALVSMEKVCLADRMQSQLPSASVRQQR